MVPSRLPRRQAHERPSRTQAYPRFTTLLSLPGPLKKVAPWLGIPTPVPASQSPLPGSLTSVPALAQLLLGQPLGTELQLQSQLSLR